TGHKGDPGLAHRIPEQVRSTLAAEPPPRRGRGWIPPQARGGFQQEILTSACGGRDEVPAGSAAHLTMAIDDRSQRTAHLVLDGPAETMSQACGRAHVARPRLAA